MRFVVAIVLFVVAFVGIGLGIAQRTVLAGPDHVTVETTTSGTAPVTVIDGSILNALPGTQTIDASGSETVFLAYGRTADVLAWVGDASYNLLEWDTEAQTLGSSVQAGLETTVPAPSGSDLWVQEFSGVEELTRKINVPADASILIVGDGETPAPSSISITWPLDNSAPWSGPLIVGGGLALLAGLAAFVWALLHARRARGPRRKQPKLPKPPKPPQLRPAKQRKAIEAAPPRGRRRLFAASGVAVVTALALGGCTFSGTPELFPVETPTASPTPGAAGTEDLPAPAVTRPQLERIMERIETTVAEADAEGDEDLAETRLAGPALELRAANYEILSSDSSQTAVPVLPQGPVEVILPQQIDTWPRTVFAVVKDENATVAPVAVMLIQETPRDNYKAHYVISLGPSTTLPDMAATAIGAPRVGTDVALGVLQLGLELTRTRLGARGAGLDLGDGPAHRLQLRVVVGARLGRERAQAVELPLLKHDAVLRRGELAPQLAVVAHHAARTRAHTYSTTMATNSIRVGHIAFEPAMLPGAHFVYSMQQ